MGLKGVFFIVKKNYKEKKGLGNAHLALCLLLAPSLE
jgi:hypothetical protein